MAMQEPEVAQSRRQLQALQRLMADRRPAQRGPHVVVLTLEAICPGCLIRPVQVGLDFISFRQEERQVAFAHLGCLPTRDKPPARVLTDGLEHPKPRLSRRGIGRSPHEAAFN
jgi:hypothetical protein